jgi:hypothetical protein
MEIEQHISKLRLKQLKAFFEVCALNERKKLIQQRGLFSLSPFSWCKTKRQKEILYSNKSRSASTNYVGKLRITENKFFWLRRRLCIHLHSFPTLDYVRNKYFGLLLKCEMGHRQMSALFDTINLRKYWNHGEEEDTKRVPHCLIKTVCLKTIKVP